MAGVYPALCAEMVDLLEEETEIGPQKGRMARNWEDSVKETTSTTRERVMAMRGKVDFEGDKNLVLRSIRQGGRPRQGPSLAGASC